LPIITNHHRKTAFIPAQLYYRVIFLPASVYRRWSPPAREATPSLRAALACGITPEEANDLASFMYKNFLKINKAGIMGLFGKQSA